MSSQDDVENSPINGLSDEDDDVLPQQSRRNKSTPRAMRGGGDNNNDEDDDLNDDADLFGSDADNLDDEKPRQLDDEDLDSGDDLDRNDRAAIDDDDEAMPDVIEEERTLTSLTVNVGRQQVPEPGDGELYLLKVPKFLAFEPIPFDPKTWAPPTTDHHLPEPSDTFNAYATAMSTIRWRKSPSDASKMQSNARILRWSDGSLTLQLASEPSKQYSLPGKPLAPPQINPAKPTPVSLKRNRDGNKINYDPSKDSFTYLLTPSSSNELLRVTNKITAGLSVQPTADAAEDAIAKLQAAMKMVEHEKGGAVQTHVTEDPELAKKRAELAEKEIARVERKRQNAAARNEGRNDRSMGRRVGGGLTVGGLEDDDDELGMGYAGGRTAAKARKPKARRPNRRGEIYSDDEEEGDIRRHTKEDEYDEEDGFVAPSDEEEEQDYIGDDDDDLDEGISLDQVKRRQKSPNRDLTPDDAVELDAEGDPDSDAGPAVGGEGSPVSRAKRRRVIDDDDED